MKVVGIAILLSLVFSALAFADDESCMKPIKYFQTDQDVARAAGNNDVHFFEFLFRDDSFHCQNAIQKTFQSKDDAAEARRQAKVLADSVCRASAVESGGCKTDIVKILDRAGVPFSVQNVVELAENGCGDALGVTLGQYKGNKVKLVEMIKLFADEFPEKYQKVTSGVFVPQKFKTIVFGAGYFSSIADALCSKKVEDACAIQPKYKGFEKQANETITQQNKQVEWTKTPGYVAQVACSTQAQLNDAQEKLNHEKEIVNESGVGDVETLHEYGRQVVDLKGQLGNLQAEYQRRSGKPLDLKTACASAEPRNVSSSGK